MQIKRRCENLPIQQQNRINSASPVSSAPLRPKTVPACFRSYPGHPTGTPAAQDDRPSFQVLPVVRKTSAVRIGDNLWSAVVDTALPFRFFFSAILSVGGTAGVSLQLRERFFARFVVSFFFLCGSLRVLSFCSEKLTQVAGRYPPTTDDGRVHFSLLGGE